MCSILFRDYFTSILTNSDSSGILASSITAIASAGTENQPLNGQGHFNFISFISNLAGTIFSSGMICYVAYSFWRISLYDNRSASGVLLLLRDCPHI